MSIVGAGIDVSPEHLIGGRRVGSESTFEVISPIDQSVIAHVSRGTAREAAMAVEAARTAFAEWAALGPAGRAPYLRRLADLIDASIEQIATVECLDMAMLDRSLKARVIARGARNYRSYAELAESYTERVWTSGSTLNRVIRMPSGPAAVITPWNAPFMLSTWKTAPALAAGSTVILKPPEWAPLSCSILAELTVEAGFPPGVFNVLQGIGEQAGAALVADPRLRRISFTGSPETGRAIGNSAAANIVPFTAELGGKGPLIVFADSDLDAAAAKAAGQYDDAGQVCLAGTRILVEQSVAQTFLERFHAGVDAQVLGDPRDDSTTISPLIHPDHLARVEGFVERARANGDRIVRGGRRSDLGGLWYEPTLIEPRSNDSEIVQREVFGPVLTYQTFRDEAHAIELANSTSYGLSAIIYTGSHERAERVGRAVRAGTVWVNTFLVRDLTAPFGGTGISGIGREGGDYALDFYSDLKTLQISEGTTGLTLTAADIQLDNDAFAERVPHELFQRMRDEAPVLWCDWPYGEGYWSITRYDDMVAVLKDWRTFSSETGGTALEDLDPDQVAARKSMLDTDPPEHSSLRAIVNKGFTPRAVAAYEQLLRELTRTILDDALTKGEFDFVEEIAKQLPIQVLCRILGVPLGDDERMIDLGDRMIGNTDPDTGGLHPASPESHEYRLLPFRSPYAEELFDYGHELAAQRRADPQDDLVSKLVLWEDDAGRRLTEQEFDTMFLLLVVAGNETTRQSIAHGMQVLMERPADMQRLRSQPEVMKPAVEEIMRWGSPVLHFRRTATVDTVELAGGQRIAAGDKVVVWLISGNYDERQFADPYTFDLTRKPNRHVTFGRGGPHFCLGAHLAVLETRVMFEELLPRVANAEPAGSPRRLESNFTNAFKSMPVRVTPAERIEG